MLAGGKDEVILFLLVYNFHTAVIKWTAMIRTQSFKCTQILRIVRFEQTIYLSAPSFRASHMKIKFKTQCAGSVFTWIKKHPNTKIIRS